MKKAHSIICWLLVVLSVPTISIAHRSLQRDRETFQLTRTEPLESAPPALAFTTVALGAFRGLIANNLWNRAVRLQDEGDYFEMVSLADWITKLQPDNSMVWAMQAWNMTYNISVQFDDFNDRWLWVRSGIELLRDQGLRYNPHSVELHRELSWFYQDKIGSNTDYGHWHFKAAWASEMAEALGPNMDLAALAAPQTEDDQARAERLREQFKLNPKWMLHVDEHFGPFDWRLPEAHAIYWADLGIQQVRNEGDVVPLRRVIWQCMQRAVQRGRVRVSAGEFHYGPNLELIPRAYRAYEEMKELEPEKADYIARGQLNFLKDAIYLYYSHNRIADAAALYRTYQETYPDLVIEGQGLDAFVVDRVTSVAGAGKLNLVVALLHGTLGRHYLSLAIGDDDQANGYALLSRQIWEAYQERNAESLQNVSLPTLEELKQQVLGQIVQGGHGFTPELRTALGISVGTETTTTDENQADTSTKPGNQD